MPISSVYIAGNSDFALPIGVKSVWRLVWKRQGNVLAMVENICMEAIILLSRQEKIFLSAGSKKGLYANCYRGI